MKNRIYINIALLLILLVFITLLTLKTDDSDFHPLTDINKDTISNIIIYREPQNIVLTKMAGKWQMIEPHMIRAHEFRVQALLDLLDTESDTHYNLAEINLATYGLNKPAAHIQYDDMHIYFGKTNPVNGMRYLQVNNEMHLLHDNVYPLIRSQPTSFVDLALLPEHVNIQFLKLPNLQLVKSAGEWHTTPKEFISTDQAQTLLQNWRFAKAFAVHAYVKRKSLGLIKLSFDNSEEIEYEISDTQPWLILARTDLGIEYHLDASQKDQLIK